MATDFPNSPANGATHTFGGNTYTYNSTMGAWTGPAAGAGGGASVTVSESAPSSPAEGDLWFDPSVLKTFVYYNDGTANQWVQSNPTGSGGGGSAGASVTASDTAPSSPSAGDLWYKSDTNALYVYYNDGDSSQWVGVSGPAGATGAAGAAATGYGQVPIVYTEPPTSHTLNTDGSTSTVQMQAVDPEGTAITYAIAYANATNARPNQLAADTAINQSTGTFTFDPSTNQAHAGSFKARLSASDGITHATRFVNVNLSFTHTLHWLVIGGGGGGGGSPSNFASGGGGGAGGYRSSWNNESSGGGASAESAITGSGGDVYTITVGAGGTGSTAAGTNGGNSSIARTGLTTITSLGGGYGGSSSATSAVSGGSGGGGQPYGNNPGGAGTANQGYAGGAGSTNGYGGGGGGGAGSVGQDDTGSNSGGDGGSGVASTITGTSVLRAGGGGGGQWNGASNSSASAGGGAGNPTAGSNGINGTANTGGGGGGGGATGSVAGTGGNGGSGVVIIRTSTQATSTTGSPVETTVGGDYVYQFNANGTITFQE